MMTFIRASLAALLMLTPAVAGGQAAWLPADLVDALAEDLAGRIRALDPEGEVVTGDSLATARAGVTGTITRIESLGPEGIFEITPRFPDLELPEAAEPHVDAIVRWAVCSFPAQAAYADASGSAGTLQRRREGAAMITTVALVNAFLRHEYLQAGTTDEEVREYYAMPEVGSVFERLRASGPLLLGAMQRCLEPLDRLMQ